MNSIADQVRKNLKLAREEARLTQTQLADKLQKSKGTVTQWECGTREIHYDALLEIAPVLGRSWLWFYQDHSQELVTLKASIVNEGLALGHSEDPSDSLTPEEVAELKEILKQKRAAGGRFTFPERKKILSVIQRQGQARVAAIQ